MTDAQTQVSEMETEQVLAADAARRAAMISGDVEALAGLLHEDLIWTHSSGKTDNRTSFLEGIGSGVVRYLALETENVTVLNQGDVFVCHGLLTGRASRDGKEKSLVNRFLNVWVRRDDGYRMIAWQSTGA